MSIVFFIGGDGFIDTPYPPFLKRRSLHGLCLGWGFGIGEIGMVLFCIFVLHWLGMAWHKVDISFTRSMSFGVEINFVSFFSFKRYEHRAVPLTAIPPLGVSAHISYFPVVPSTGLPQSFNGSFAYNGARLRYSMLSIDCLAALISWFSMVVRSVNVRGPWTRRSRWASTVRQ